MSVDLLSEMAASLPPGRLLDDQADAARFLTDWRGLFTGPALGVVQPRTTNELASIARLCTAHDVSMVPQGGNTGLCGAATPGARRSLLISFDRMDAMREVDLDNGTMTVEAGCILSAVQRRAESHHRLFPLSLAAEGSAQIGGLLSTNAGGTAVLRYGCARELVLGLEVVLSDGQVWDGLRGLRKDNTGYDLRQSFIGAEGTLGFITAAVLKLYPAPARRATALLGLANLEAALALFRAARSTSSDRLTTFEVFSRECLDAVLSHLPSARDPFRESHRWYALVELSDAWIESPLDNQLEALLSLLAEAGSVRDAVLAHSQSQREALWALREQISEAQRLDGYVLKFDVSLPIGEIAPFVRETTAELVAAFPGLRVAPFGHLGDGNVHFNVAPASGSPAQGARIAETVYESVMCRRGSFSAEHGIGQLKLGEMRRYKSAIELDLMGRLKRAFDPSGLMNPGKVLA